MSPSDARYLRLSSQKAASGKTAPPDAFFPFKARHTISSEITPPPIVFQQVGKESGCLNYRRGIPSVLKIRSYTMKLRYLLPALFMSTLPLALHADFEFSINIAPPALPVYEQPACPTEGYLWTPGYWAYADSGYYWVPGVWVAPPTVGLLWTPGYWAFTNGIYGYNAGYWGPTVGFYGGVNYGFGYSGVGFGGGRWDGGAFRYNTAVTNVNTTIIHNTYEDRTVVNNAAAGRASFNGPGGVSARPTAAEEAAAKQSHTPATAAQLSSRTEAAKQPGLAYKNNHGNPAPALAKATSAKPEAKPEAKQEAKTPEAAQNKPEAGKPGTAEPKPEAGKPGTAEAKPEAGKPETAEAKPEAGKPEAAEAKPEAKKSEAAEAKPEAKKSETAEAKPEAKKSETAEAKPQAKKSEAAEAKPKATAKPAAKEEEKAKATPAKTKAEPEARGEKDDKKKKDEPQ
jgi:hypothetical protein